MFLVEESNRLEVGISCFEEDYNDLKGIVTMSQQYLQTLASEKAIQEDTAMKF